MEDTKTYTGCYHCNDWFEVTPEVIGLTPDMSDLIKSIINFRWWNEEKECLHCHNKYTPSILALTTYPFVFEAFRTVKM